MTVNTGGIAGGQLRNFIERIERVEEEKKGLSEDIKEIYAQAKAVGFDPKIMRKCISLRKMDTADRQEQEALIEVYLRSIEQPFESTPLAAASAGVSSTSDQGGSNIVALN